MGFNSGFKGLISKHFLILAIKTNFVFAYSNLKKQVWQTCMQIYWKCVFKVPLGFKKFCLNDILKKILWNESNREWSVWLSHVYSCLFIRLQLTWELIMSLYEWYTVIFINFFTALSVAQTDWLNFRSICGLTLSDSYLIQVTSLYLSFLS